MSGDRGNPDDMHCVALLGAPTMKDTDECLKLASECEEMAEAAMDETNRVAFQNAAARWRRRAEETGSFAIHAALQADAPYQARPPR
jgi:hypothetical protein